MPESKEETNAKQGELLNEMRDPSAIHRGARMT